MEHSNDPFAPVWPKDEEIDLLSQKGKEQFRELESESSTAENPFSDETPYYNMVADIEVAKINQRADLLKSVLNRAETLNLDTPDKVVEATERFAAWIGGTGAEAGETRAGTVSGAVPDVPPYLRD